MEDEIDQIQQEVQSMNDNEEHLARRAQYIAQFQDYGIEYDTPVKSNPDRLYDAMSSGRQSNEVDGFDCMYRVDSSARAITLSKEASLVSDSNVEQLPPDLKLALTYRRAGLEPEKLDLSAKADAIQMVPNGNVAFDVMRKMSLVLETHPNALSDTVTFLDVLAKDVELSIGYLEQFRQTFDNHRQTMDRMTYKTPQPFTSGQIPPSVLGLLAAMGAEAKTLDLTQEGFQSLWGSLSNAVSQYEALGLGRRLSVLSSDYYSVNPDQILVTAPDQPNTVAKIKTEMDRLLPTLVTVTDITQALKVTAESATLVNNYVKSVEELRGSITLTAGNNGVFAIVGLVALGIITMIGLLFIRVLYMVVKKVKEAKAAVLGDLKKAAGEVSFSASKSTPWSSILSSSSEKTEDLLDDIDEHLDDAMACLPKVRAIRPDSGGLKASLFADIDKALAYQKATNQTTVPYAINSILDFKGIVVNYNPIEALISSANENGIAEDHSTKTLQYLVMGLSNNLYRDPEGTDKEHTKLREVLKDTIEYVDELVNWVTDIASEVDALCEEDPSKCTPALLKDIKKVPVYAGSTVNKNGVVFPYGNNVADYWQGTIKPVELGEIASEKTVELYQAAFNNMPRTDAIQDEIRKNLMGDFPNDSNGFQSRRRAIKKVLPKGEDLSLTIKKIEDCNKLSRKIWDGSGKLYDNLFSKMAAKGTKIKTSCEKIDKVLGAYIQKMSPMAESNEQMSKHLAHCKAIRAATENIFRASTKLVSGFGGKDAESQLNDACSNCNNYAYRVVRSYRDTVMLVAYYSKLSEKDAGLNTGIAMALDYEKYDLATSDVRDMILAGGLNKVNPRLKRLFFITFLLGILTALSAYLIKKNSQLDSDNFKRKMKNWSDAHESYLNNMQSWASARSEELKNDNATLKRLNAKLDEEMNGKPSVSKQNIKKLNDMIVRSVKLAGDVDKTEFTIAQAKVGYGMLTEAMQKDLLSWWASSMFNKKDRMKTSKFEAQFLSKNLSKVEEIKNAVVALVNPKYHTLQGSKQFEAEHKLFAIQHEVSKFLSDMDSLGGAKLADENKLAGTQEMVAGMVNNLNVESNQSFWSDIAEPDFYDWDGFEEVLNTSLEIGKEVSRLEPIGQVLDKTIADLLTTFEGIKDSEAKASLVGSVKMAQKTCKGIITRAIHYQNLVKYYHMLGDSGINAFRQMYKLGENYVYKATGMRGTPEGGNNSFSFDLDGGMNGVKAVIETDVNDLKGAYRPSNKQDYAFYHAWAFEAEKNKGPIEEYFNKGTKFLSAAIKQIMESKSVNIDGLVKSANTAKQWLGDLEGKRVKGTVSLSNAAKRFPNVDIDRVLTKNDLEQLNAYIGKINSQLSKQSNEKLKGHLNQAKQLSVCLTIWLKVFAQFKIANESLVDQTSPFKKSSIFGGNNSFVLGSFDEELEDDLIDGNNGIVGLGVTVAVIAIIGTFLKRIVGIVKKTVNEESMKGFPTKANIVESYKQAQTAIRSRKKGGLLDKSINDVLDTIEKQNIPNELGVSAKNLNSYIHLKFITAENPGSSKQAVAILSDMLTGKVKYRDNIGKFIYDSPAVIPSIAANLEDHLKRFLAQVEKGEAIDPDDYDASKLTFQMKGGKSFPVETYCKNIKDFVSQAESSDGFDPNKVTPEIIIECMAEMGEISFKNLGSGFNDKLKESFSTVQKIAKEVGEKDADKRKIAAAKSIASAYSSLTAITVLWSTYFERYKAIVKGLSKQINVVNQLAAKD